MKPANNVLQPPAGGLSTAELAPFPAPAAAEHGRSADKMDRRSIRSGHQVVAICLLLHVGATASLTNISTLFEAAAVEAPIIVIAHPDHLDGGVWSLSIIKVIRGPATGTTA